MKKILISLLLFGAGFSGYAQMNTFGGIGLRVNDTTTYQTNAADYHSAGYRDIYFNNQATNKHFDIWNGSSYDHVFNFGGTLTSADNGLNVSGTTVKLGGELLDDTWIYGNDYNLNLGGIGQDSLARLNVNTKIGVDINTLGDFNSNANGVDFNALGDVTFDAGNAVNLNASNSVNSTTIDFIVNASGSANLYSGNNNFEMSNSLDNISLFNTGFGGLSIGAISNAVKLSDDSGNNSIEINEGGDFMDFKSSDFKLNGSSAGTPSTMFFRGDGTWAVPPGGSTPTLDQARIAGSQMSGDWDNDPTVDNAYYFRMVGNSNTFLWKGIDMSALDYIHFTSDGNMELESVSGTINLTTSTSSIDVNDIVDQAYADTHLYGYTATNSPTTGFYPKYNGTNITWDAPSAGPINNLLAATGTNTINNADYNQEWQWNSLSSGTGLLLSSSSTAASGGTNRLFRVNQTGANATSSQVTYAASFNNTKTGTSSFNVAMEVEASGGSAGNYAMYVRGGHINMPDGQAIGWADGFDNKGISMTSNVLKLSAFNELTFYNWDGGAYSERMRLTTGGDLVVGTTTSGARLHSRGSGTTTGFNLLTENSSGTDRFGVLDNGEVQFSGSAGTTGQVLTSAGAGAPPTWTSQSIQTAKITISSAELLALNSTPKTLVAAGGANTIIDIISVEYFYDYNSSAYITNTSLWVSYNAAGANLHNTALSLSGTVDVFTKLSIDANPTYNTATRVNTPVVAYVSTGNPASGNGVVNLYVTYRIITL